MRIAVTGGSGKLGRAVIELALEEGHSVVNIDQQSPVHDWAGEQFVAVHMADYQGLLRAFSGCDAVIHLAAITNPEDHQDYEVHNQNVAGGYNVMRAAVEAKIRRVSMASSINAIGGVFSRRPGYDFLPIDETHPSYCEDPYSLSKWVCEQQADCLTRRFDKERFTVASLRIHGLVDDITELSEARNSDAPYLAKQLWGYTLTQSAARACLLGISADFVGHEVFFIVAPQTMHAWPSHQLVTTYFPGTELTQKLEGHAGLYDCSRAKQLLGWVHD